MGVEANIVEFAQGAVWHAQVECLSCPHARTWKELDPGTSEPVNGLVPVRLDRVLCDVEEYRECPGARKLLSGILEGMK